ncbi:D-alanyl-D-alanine carboxypeptidase [Streptomyces sp. NBC_00444]|uniref:D-alanyl-D-alanine carboxypeptidase n=1 Tax=Streptomyces sp. NBC_00444 TaxID=2975744 RepID=UPI003FA71C1F
MRRMEEASVAGESPDRSKKRESSAEPTSGSAGPVPEARSEAADPRLAVARDAGSSSSSTSEARGGVDTATKVFSVRDLPKDVRDAAGAAGDAGEAEGDGVADSAAPEDSSGGDEGNAGDAGGDEGDGVADSAAPEDSSGGDEENAADADGDEASAGDAGGGEENAGGDDRLRAAVAAWVATADEEPSEGDAGAEGDEGETAGAVTSEGDEDVDGDAATSEAAEDADGDVTTSEGADEGAEGGDEAAGGAEAAAETDAEPEADAEPDADAETGVAASSGDVDAAGDAGAADAGTEVGSEAKVASGAGAELEGDADADGDAEADATARADAEADAEPEAESEGDADAKTEADSEAGVDSQADAEPEGDVDAETGADSEGGAEADAEGKVGSEAAAESEPEAGAEPEAEADSESEGDVDAETRAGSADEADADAHAAAEADDAAVAGSGSEPKADAEPEGDADGEAAADAEPESDAGSEAAADSEPEPDADVEPGAGAGDGGVGAEGSSKADKPPVDQPTAVFKAVRPSAPSVDQPTTMLKLGGVAKPEPKDADQPEKADEGPSRKAVADVERTSRFVALKPLDEPRPAAPDVTSDVPQVGPERTTQQPLPPKPPLDLLAELTNTPPPPQTPLRTAARRVKIWTPLVLLLVIVFGVVQSVRPLPTPTLDLTAKDAYTFEGGKVDIPWPSDGQAALNVQGIGTFGSSGDQKPVPIASVAKVMTAYVILKDHPLKSGEDGPKIKIDQTAQDQSDAGQESTVDVTAGDSITQREALESILIASANNVARLLARWDAGSEKAFVEKMNAAAEDLGMTNTTYTDPSGLNDTTVSTAVDQVKLAEAAMEAPAFREVAAMMSYDDYKGVNHSNWNQLVGKNNVVGIKTGTTTSALGNLVFAAKKDIGGETRTIVGAVIRQPAGGPENTIISAALDGGDKLIRAAQDALQAATIIKKGEVVGSVDDGLGGRTPVVATKDVTAVGWSSLKVKLDFAADAVPHTAKAGTKVGTLTVGDGSTAGAVKVPVALQTDLGEPGFTDKLTRVA